MIATHSDCPASVTMLADHLDATLAAGEDLLAVELASRADLDAVDPAVAPDAFDQFVHRLGQLEASLVARLMLARRRAGELGRVDADVNALVRLFRAETEVIDTLITGLRPGDASALGTAGDGYAYLRSRGLIAPEAAAPSPFERLVVTEAFRVGATIPLRQLLDLAASLLDLLDVRFGLYLDEMAADAGAATAVPAVTEAAAVDPVAPSGGEAPADATANDVVAAEPGEALADAGRAGVPADQPQKAAGEAPSETSVPSVALPVREPAAPEALHSPG